MYLMVNAVTTSLRPRLGDYSGIAPFYPRGLNTPNARKGLEMNDPVLSRLVAQHLLNLQGSDRTGIRVFNASAGFADVRAILNGLPGCCSGEEQQIDPSIIADVVMIDADRGMLEQPTRSKNYKGHNIITYPARMQNVGHGNAVDFLGKFDIALISHVFAQAQASSQERHLCEVYTGLANVKKIMKPDGKIFVNFRDIQAMREKGDHHYSFEGDGLFVHYNWYFGNNRCQEALISFTNDPEGKNVLGEALIPMGDMNEQEFRDICNDCKLTIEEFEKQDQGDKGIFYSAQLGLPAPA